MKEFFSKIKSGVKNILNNIKKTFNNIKNRIIGIFSRKKDKESQTINQTMNVRENNKNLSNEIQNVNSTFRENNITNSINYQIPRTSIRTNGNETIMIPVQRNENQTNSSTTATRVVKPPIPVISTINNIPEGIKVSSTEQSKKHIDTTNYEEKIYSIDINEEKGIVEFKTISGKKYKRNIQDIMDEKKDIYAKFEINQKCRDFTKNRIQAIKLKRKLNPVIIDALHNDEEINKYIECVNNVAGLWFNLKHNLINSRLRGKNARLMKRAGKTEEKIGGEVYRKKGLIEKLLDKIRREEKNDIISKDIENLEENNEEFENNIEENNQEKNKEDDMKRKGNYELNRRYDFYANLARRLYQLRPLKTLEQIKKSDIDRELYELTSNDPLIKAIATLNVGKRLSKTNVIEAFKYLNDAEKQFKNENLLANSEKGFDYLEETLLSLRNLYLKQNDYSSAEIINKRYMRILERERIDKINPLMLQARIQGNDIAELDYWMKYRRKLINGQKGEVFILSMTGRYFDAEELYRQMLDDSGIILSPEEYDLSKKNNCIRDGKYVKISKGKAITYSIIGDEALLTKKKQIMEGKNKKQQKKPSSVSSQTDINQGKRVVASPNIIKKKVVKGQGGVLGPIANIIQNIRRINQKFERESGVTKLGKTILEEYEKAEAERKAPEEQQVIGEKQEEKKSRVQPIIEVTEGQPEEKTGNKALEGQTRIETERKVAEEQARIETERKAAEKQARIEAERKAAEEQARIEAERKAAEEQARIEAERKKEEAKKAQLEEFNKRYSSYSVLSKGLIGGKAKKSLDEINKSVIHRDIYDMTSEDELVKGIATYKTGHRLATVPGKKKEAERLLKSAITILGKNEVLSREENVICTLEDSHLDLGELYVENGEFSKAERTFEDYMKTVKREKLERYDPKIKEARAQGKTIDELDCWMEYRAKLTTGRKAMIRLLSKSGDKKSAEALYKKLLEDCKISLTDEEYQLSVSSNCIEDGSYMRITQGKTYIEPILGNETLLLKKKMMGEKALSER